MSSKISAALKEGLVAGGAGILADMLCATSLSVGETTGVSKMVPQVMCNVMPNLLNNWGWFSAGGVALSIGYAGWVYLKNSDCFPERLKNTAEYLGEVVREKLSDKALLLGISMTVGSFRNMNAVRDALLFSCGILYNKWQMREKSSEPSSKMILEKAVEAKKNDETIKREKLLDNAVTQITILRDNVKTLQESNAELRKALKRNGSLIPCQIL
jgi:hypothetical protein